MKKGITSLLLAAGLMLSTTNSGTFAVDSVPSDPAFACEIFYTRF